MCEAIDSSARENNTLGKLYAAANIYYNYTGTATCFNLDDDSDPHDLGGWQWQVLLHIAQYFNYNQKNINFMFIL
jgi:lysosomal Pro-X carboxypeptidase